MLYTLPKAKLTVKLIMNANTAPAPVLMSASLAVPKAKWRKTHTSPNAVIGGVVQGKKRKVDEQTSDYGVAHWNSSEEAAPSPKRRALQDIRQANAATSLSTDQDSELDASMSERPQSQKENAPWDNSTLRQTFRARTVQKAKQAKRAFKGLWHPLIRQKAHPAPRCRAAWLPLAP